MSADDLFTPIQWSLDYDIVEADGCTIFAVDPSITDGIVAAWAVVLIDNSRSPAHWGIRFFSSPNQAGNWIHGAIVSGVADFSHIDMGESTGRDFGTTITTADYFKQAWERYTAPKS